MTDAEKKDYILKNLPENYDGWSEERILNEANEKSTPLLNKEDFYFLLDDLMARKYVIPTYINLPENRIQTYPLRFLSEAGKRFVSGGGLQQLKSVKIKYMLAQSMLHIMLNGLFGLDY